MSSIRRAWSAVVVCATFFGIGKTASAQVVEVLCADPVSLVVRTCSVDSAAAAVQPRPAPNFPRLFQGMQQTFTVTADLLVDMEGSVRVLRIVPDSQWPALWEEVVRAALANTKFTPALRYGLPVATLVKEEYRFETPDEAPPLPIVMTESHTADGTRQLRIGRPPRTSIEPWTVSPEDSSAAVTAVILEALRLFPAAGAPVCVSSPPRRDAVIRVVELDRLRVGGVTVVREEQCPRSLRGMFPAYDSAGRRIAAPPEHVDPYHVAVTRLYTWSPTIVVVETAVSQSGMRRLYRCSAYRDMEVFVVACENIRTSIAQASEEIDSQIPGASGLRGVTYTRHITSV